jgi:hypothetical protein
VASKKAHNGRTLRTRASRLHQKVEESHIQTRPEGMGTGIKQNSTLKRGSCGANPLLPVPRLGMEDAQMKLEHQVVSLELSKRLKELGVKQKSLWCWANNMSDRGFYLKTGWRILPWDFFITEETNPEIISAFTVTELYKILSELDPHWDFNDSIGLIPEEVADYLAEKVIHLKEKGLI